MKNILYTLLITSALIFTGCKSVKKQYRLSVTYTNNQTEILTFEGFNDNVFSLYNGDLKANHTTLVSGVRYFTCLSIINLGEVNYNETNNIKLIKKEIQ